MTSPTSMTQSAALKVPTREQCEKATWHLVRALNDSAANRLNAFADNISKAASALGFRLSADEPAQQPQSDLVKRLREPENNWNSGGRFEAAARIEALEAEVADLKKEREAVEFLRKHEGTPTPEIMAWAEKTHMQAEIDELRAALEAAAAQPMPPLVEALVKAARAYMRDTDNWGELEQALKPFPATYIGSAYEVAAAQPPEREKALYDIRWTRDDGELLGCHGLTARTVFSRLRGAIANSGPITVHSIEPAAYAPAKAEKS